MAARTKDQIEDQEARELVRRVVYAGEDPAEVAKDAGVHRRSLAALVEELGDEVLEAAQAEDEPTPALADLPYVAKLWEEAEAPVHADTSPPIGLEVRAWRALLWEVLTTAKRYPTREEWLDELGQVGANLAKARGTL